MINYNYKDIIILYEDNHLLVVVKPQGLPCCPDVSNSANLLDLMKKYLVEKYNKPGDAYLGLVHRLDQPTGGVMLYAKSSKAASRLANNLKERDVNKKYLAVCEGIPKRNKAILKNALSKDTIKNEVYCVPVATEGAKMAELEYKVIVAKEDLSLLEIHLITGRSHQARVQLANIGCPIWGDQKYGKAVGHDDLALWASELSFPHPVSKDLMTFKVFPPIEKFPWSDFSSQIKINIGI